MASRDRVVSLADYWKVVSHRRRTLVITWAAVVLVTAVFNFTRVPLYRASATLIVEPDIPEMAELTGVTPLYLSREFYETQWAILRSDEVLGRVAKAERLDGDAVLGAEATRLATLRRLISVEPVGHSRLVRIGIDHPDPQVALRLTTTLAEVFIAFNVENRQKASRNAFSWLSNQIEVLKKEVEEAERAVLEYSSQHDIDSLVRRQTLLEEQIAGLTSELHAAEGRTRELDIQLSEVKRLQTDPDRVEALPRDLQTAQLKLLTEELGKLSLELGRLSARYKPKHPEVVDLQARVDDLRTSLQGEVAKIAESLSTELRITAAKEAGIAGNLAQRRQESIRGAEEAIRYRVLEREAESNREMFDVLLQRLRETDVSGSIEGQNIRILDAAAVGSQPFKPRKALNLAVGLVVGLVLGIGLCFAVEQVDNTFKNEDDLERDLAEPLLGVIPRQKTPPHSAADVGPVMSKAYGVVKTRLQLYRRDHVLRTVLVTSAVRGEGKSVSALSLAATMAHSGQRVLLVDTDLFQGSIATLVFGSRESHPRGVSDYFLHGTRPSDLIVPSGLPKLDVMPSGLIPPDPAAPLASPLMRDLVELISPAYDIVILDSPPLTGALDVAFLAAIADGIIVAVKANSTPRTLVERVVRQLRASRGNVVGLILTFVADSSRSAGAYGYYYYPGTSELGAGQDAAGAPPPERPTSA